MTPIISLPNCGVDDNVNLTGIKMMENSVESIMDLDAANNSLRDSKKWWVFLFGTQFNHATQHWVF